MLPGMFASRKAFCVGGAVCTEEQVELIWEYGPMWTEDHRRLMRMKTYCHMPYPTPVTFPLPLWAGLRFRTISHLTFSKCY